MAASTQCVSVHPSESSGNRELRRPLTGMSREDIVRLRLGMIERRHGRN
jgi:hypothetical protein